MGGLPLIAAALGLALAPVRVGPRGRSFTAKNAPFLGAFCMVLLYPSRLSRQGLRAIFYGLRPKVIICFKSKKCRGLYLVIVSRALL